MSTTIFLLCPLLARVSHKALYSLRCSVWPSCYHEGPFHIILKSVACSLLFKLHDYFCSLALNAFRLKKKLATSHSYCFLQYDLSLFGRPFRSTYLSLNKGCQSLCMCSQGCSAVGKSRAFICASNAKLCTAVVY